jgi:hypothetical protein
MFAALGLLMGDALPAHASGRTLLVSFTRLENKRAPLRETI